MGLRSELEQCRAIWSFSRYHLSRLVHILNDLSPKTYRIQPLQWLVACRNDKFCRFAFESRLLEIDFGPVRSRIKNSASAMVPSCACVKNLIAAHRIQSHRAKAMVAVIIGSLHYTSAQPRHYYIRSACLLTSNRPV